MLPGVDTEDGPELAHDGVLIRVCLDLNAAGLGVLHQPCPAAALDARQRGIELLLEGIQAAVALIDGTSELAGRGLAAALGGGRQVLPEEGVVDVAAAVEVDQGLQGDLGLDVVLGLCLGDLLAEVVVRCHVGVVVVLVVKLHDLAADGGLEGAVVIWTAPVRPRAKWERGRMDVHARSGRVAFPRTKVVPAMAARAGTARRAERTAVVRRRVEFMVVAVQSIGAMGEGYERRGRRRRRRKRRRKLWPRRAKIITTLPCFVIANARASELSKLRSIEELPPPSPRCAGPMVSVHGPAKGELRQGVSGGLSDGCYCHHVPCEAGCPDVNRCLLLAVPPRSQSAPPSGRWTLLPSLSKHHVRRRALLALTSRP